MRHTVILSDLHLWQTTDHDDMWMRYRHRRFAPDAKLAALVEQIYERIGTAPLELVLNGDIFDFDIPPVVDGQVVPAAAPRTGLEARIRLAAILDDHELFLATLARVLQRGDHVIFISGNHDIQLSLPEVRDYLTERLLNTLRICYPSSRDYKTHERIRFRCWYYQTVDGVHIEHGNQYDVYCSVPDPATPLGPRHRLRPNAGSLVIEHLIGHLGYFNPNVDSTFLLTTREYLEHWRTYYRRSRRSLVGTWFFGSLRICWQLGRSYGFRGLRAPRTTSQPADSPPGLPHVQQEHAALFALPEVRVAIRLLCIDRALLAIAALAALLLLFIWPPLTVLLLFIALGVGYALRPPADACVLHEVAAQVAHSARAIARIHRARAVVFGHTHKASEQWQDGIFYGNSGTWAPMYHDVACTIAVESSGPLIWLRADDDTLSGGLYRFHDGALHPAVEPPRTPPPPARLRPRRPTRPQRELAAIRLLT